MSLVFPAHRARRTVEVQGCLITACLRDDFGSGRSMLARRLAPGRNLRILAHLLEMGAHRAAGHLGVAALHRLDNAFVMKLAALRPTFHGKDSNALLTQQADNGIK